MSDPLVAMRSVTADGWIVGGAVRDRLLGRATSDIDIAVSVDPGAAARELARVTDSHVFKLSEEFGVWRVVARDHGWQVDVLPVAERSIEVDLARRDFTVNAIAEPLGGGEYVDPFRGIADLRARRLRMVSEHAFAADPLRTLRLARIACELDFSVDPATATAARASANVLGRVAGERIFVELSRIIAAERVIEGFQLMDTLGATDAVLPELSLLRGVEQSRYHHLDVHDHTRAVLAEVVRLERDPAAVFAADAEGVERLLAEPLANDLTRGHALRFGALFHDMAKPQTRDVTAEGRVTFIGHDRTGAEMARVAMTRLRASDRLSEYVAALVRNHLRLGFLVHEMPLSRRTVYRYLKACEPVQADVTLLSVADRLATRGRGSDEAIARHLELARQVLGEALAWREHPPRPPVRGDQLADALGLDPGPEIGRLLEELGEASYAGEINGRQEAIERARALVSGAG